MNWPSFAPVTATAFSFSCGIAVLELPARMVFANELVATLRIILNCLVNTHQVQGFDELEEALGEAVGAYNSDIDELGVSPSQAAALGRQPRMSGDVLGSFSRHLGEHGLISYQSICCPPSCTERDRKSCYDQASFFQKYSPQ